jgi:DNA-binding beta-propeller fold protein YncE
MATPAVAAGVEPSAIAVSPDGNSVYVTNGGSVGTGGVSQYNVGPGGALAPMATPTVAAGNGPNGIAVSPDGRSV